MKKQKPSEIKKKELSAHDKLEDLVRDYLKENSLRQLETELRDLKVDVNVLPKNPMAIAQAIKYALDSQPERLEYLEKYQNDPESDLIGLLMDTLPSSLD
jgi:ATP/maltotriose-dependent transcriptional regulator MalT